MAGMRGALRAQGRGKGEVGADATPSPSDREPAKGPQDRHVCGSVRAALAQAPVALHARQC
eukprot:1371377-Heterocapsa_arctica.AAC.1